MVAEVNWLYDAGHTIMLLTARGSTTGIDWRPPPSARCASGACATMFSSSASLPPTFHVDDKAINALTWRRDGFASEAETLILERKLEADEPSGRVVYFNGQLVPEAEARISIYDSALMFGDMVFEMTRSFGKKQFKLRGAYRPPLRRHQDSAFRWR